MGTKNDPGKFDCYKAAEPDEPTFVLLGRDPSASLLVMLWAELRHAMADAPNDVEKAMEASYCAGSLAAWAVKLKKGPRIMDAATALIPIIAKRLTTPTADRRLDDLRTAVTKALQAFHGSAQYGSLAHEALGDLQRSANVLTKTLHEAVVAAGNKNEVEVRLR